jgi:hypothetical protein
MQLLIRAAILCVLVLAPRSVAAHDQECGTHDHPPRSLRVSRDPVLYAMVPADRPGLIELRTRDGTHVPFEVEGLAGPGGFRVLRLDVDHEIGRFEVVVDGEVDSVVDILSTGEGDPRELAAPKIKFVSDGVARLAFHHVVGAFRVTWTPDGGAPISWTQVDELHGDFDGSERPPYGYFSGRALVVWLGCARCAGTLPRTPGRLAIEKLLSEGPAAPVFAMRTPIDASSITRLAVSPLERRVAAHGRTSAMARRAADGWALTLEGVALALLVVTAGVVAHRFARRRWTLTLRP